MIKLIRVLLFLFACMVSPQLVSANSTGREQQQPTSITVAQAKAFLSSQNEREKVNMQAYLRGLIESSLVVNIARVNARSERQTSGYCISDYYIKSESNGIVEHELKAQESLKIANEILSHSKNLDTSVAVEFNNELMKVFPCKNKDTSNKGSRVNTSVTIGKTLEVMAAGDNQELDEMGFYLMGAVDHAFVYYLPARRRYLCWDKYFEPGFNYYLDRETSLKLGWGAVKDELERDPDMYDKTTTAQVVHSGIFRKYRCSDDKMTELRSIIIEREKLK